MRRDNSSKQSVHKYDTMALESLLTGLPLPRADPSLNFGTQLKKKYFFILVKIWDSEFFGKLYDYMDNI